MHSTIKRDLPHRRLHLREVIRLFQSYIKRRNEHIKYKLSNDRVRIDLKLRLNPLFNGLYESISTFAMDKVVKHIQSFKEGRTTGIGRCTNTFSYTWGLPCAHLYAERTSKGDSLRVDDFHIQWRLDRLRQLPPIDPLLLIKDPIRVRSRLTTNAEENRREPSLVEHIRNSLKALVNETPTNEVSTSQGPWQAPTEEPVHHYPASINTMPRNPDEEVILPLYLTSMGDGIP
jgi:hypothetical protein